jgi:hypothetical protein
MSFDPRISEDVPEPGDRLGEIAERLGKAFDADPAKEDGDRLIVLLAPPVKGERGMIYCHEYPDEATMLDDLGIYVKALFEAHGQQVTVLPVGQG